MIQKRHYALGVALLAFAAWKLFVSPEKLKHKVPFQLVYRETLVGGKSKDPLPMLILLHGSGGNEKDWLNLFTGPKAFRIISFRGPASKMFGYDWFPDFRENSQEAADLKYMEFLKQSAESVARSLHELTQKYPTRGKPYLAGFSSGANLSYLIAATYPSNFAVIFPVSGELPSPLLSSLSPIESDTPIIAYHGTKDQVISVGSGRAAVEKLNNLGLKASLSEFEGEHIFTKQTANEIITQITK